MSVAAAAAFFAGGFFRVRLVREGRRRGWR